jgi:hypothetical protein
MFDLMVQQAKPRFFSDEQIRSMSVQSRRYMNLKNGAAIQCPSELVKLLEGRELTEGDREAARRIMMEGASTANSHYRGEAWTNLNGGSQHYEPTTVTRIGLSNTKEVRQNSAIPMAAQEIENRSNVQAVAAVAAQLVGVNSETGEWESTVPANTWNKLLPKDGGMEPAGMVTVANTVSLVLNNTPLWKGMTPIKKSATTGPEALVHILKELDNISADEYDLLNTRIVYKLLKPFEFHQGNWYERENDQGKPLVPDTSYAYHDCSQKCKQQILSETYPACYWYLGGWAPQLNLPMNNGTFKQTLERYSKMVEAQVGGDSCTAILAGMRGFSGLTDNFGKRVQFYLAATLAGWRAGKVVDVVLYSVGDLPMLISSLNKWATYIRVEDDKLQDPNLHFVPDRKVLTETKFVLKTAQDLRKIRVELHDYCIHFPRERSTLIVYDDTALPNSSEKGVTVDYQASAKLLIPEIWRKNDLIAYMPVFHELFWETVEYADAKLSSSNSSELERSQVKYVVYQWGVSSSFRGIVSTFENLSLVGYGRQQVGKPPKWDMTVENCLVPVSLLPVRSFDDWMKIVGIDCQVQIVAWLRPISRYSPISNLPYLSKKGVVISLSMIEGEDGYLIGNTTRQEAPQQKRGKMIGSRTTLSSSNSSAIVTLTTTNTTTTTEVAPRVRRVIGGGGSVSPSQVDTVVLTDVPEILQQGDEPQPELNPFNYNAEDGVM